MENVNNPVQVKDRSEILDILRGIALFGICIANYPPLSLYSFQNDEVKSSLPANSFDHVLGFIQSAFFEGKFYSLFSLLFGVGFSIILLRNKYNQPLAEGKSGLFIFYRRLLVLAVFGLAHSFLLWEGDILLLYALIGMLLPFFRNISDRLLLISWAVLILSPILIDSIKVLTKFSFDPALPLINKAVSVSEGYGITQNNYANWKAVHPQYIDMLRYNHSSFFWRWSSLIDSNRLLKVLGMFILGYLAGRRMIHMNLRENTGLLKRVRNWGLIFGIPASIVFAFFQEDKWRFPAAEGLTDTIAYALSVVPLCLGYTATICLWYIKNPQNKFLKMFVSPGRMALTNYLGQTIFAVFIFYGIGFGWGAKVSLATSMIIAVIVFTIEIYLSYLWLKTFQYGPVEWIWRQLTYGKTLKIKKTAPPI